MSSLIESYFEGSRDDEVKEYKLRILPEQPNFGIICQGFVYGLSITVFNSGLKPERLRVFCHPAEGSLNHMSCTYEPVRLAPGMSTLIHMKIEAKYCTVSSARLRIVQASTQIEKEWTIKATAVPIEMYQSVTKSLKMQGRPITEERVKALGQLHGLEPGKLTDDGAETSFSKAFMDHDEVKEIGDFPFVDCVYYDPWEKKLKVDDEMLSVEVDTKWELNDSIDCTSKKWANRLSELEDKGMFTARTASMKSAEGALKVASRTNSPTNSHSGGVAAGGI
jgi:hypothetical protein